MKSTNFDPMAPTLCRIERIHNDTYDTFTLEIIPDDPKKGFAFAAGQFNMLYVFGVGEVPISISGDPTKPSVLIHTIRSVGSVTAALRKLKQGDTVGVRGPFGKPWPVSAGIGKDVVLITGGIGLAPLRPVLYEMSAHRAQYQQIVLLYGARTPDDILYRKEVEKWRGRLDLDVHVTVDRATPDWHGDVGVVTTLIPKATFNSENAIAMICGPEIMMRFTVIGLQKVGMKPEQIYLSMERGMKCGIGLCGHCQHGASFICKDGPVYRYDQIAEHLGKREL